MGYTMQRIRPRNRSTFTLIAFMAALTCLVGCAPGAPPGPPPAQAATGAPGQGTAAAPAPAGTAPAAPESPADAALRLEALFGQHAILAADLMRGRLRNDEDFAQSGERGRRPEHRRAGPAGRRTLRRPARAPGSATCGWTTSRRCSTTPAAWPPRTTPSARRPGPSWSARERPRRPLRHRVTGQAGPGRRPCRGAGPRRSPHPAGRRLRGARLRRGQHRVPPGLPADLRPRPPAGDHPPAAGQSAELDAPSWRLRSELTRLLVEHVGLALSALRAGATRSPDFPAAVTALNGNTSDVTAAVDSLFGEPPPRSSWRCGPTTSTCWGPTPPTWAR